MLDLRRREFMALLGGAAVAPVAWPLPSLAQQNDRIRRIGVLLGATEERDPESQTRINALRQGLAALGWTEGRNVQIDYRFAGGDADRIRTDVAELVYSAPDLIVGNSSPVIAALKQATRAIPIVFAVVNDPVGQGFVASLAHPAGNITGFALIEFEMIGKWMELLKEMAPRIRRTTLMFNPVTAPYYTRFLRELGARSASFATELAAAPVQDRAEIEGAVAAVAREPGGLITGADPFAVANRALIIRAPRKIAASPDLCESDA